MKDIFVVISEHNNSRKDILGFFDNFEVAKEYVDSFIKQCDPHIADYDEYYKVYARKIIICSDPNVNSVFAECNSSNYYEYTVDIDKDFKTVWVKEDTCEENGTE